MSSPKEHSSKSWWGKLKEAFTPSNEKLRPLVEKLYWGTGISSAIALKYAPFLIPNLLAITATGWAFNYFILKDKGQSGSTHH